MTVKDNSNSITEKRELTPEMQPEQKIIPSKKNVLASRFKRRILKHVMLLRLLLISATILLLTIGFFQIKNYYTRTNAGFYVSLAEDFLRPNKDKVKTADGRTNLLILGKGGEGHEAPDLTDSIMLLSVDHDTGKINLISLPRDIWIPELRTKINSTYYWGNKKTQGGGLTLAKSTVEEVVGQPVHYAVVIDFSGFKNIIDTLGGIEVEVENDFTDKRFPIAGKEADLCEGDREFNCRYETISFTKGTHHMDGETALKYVRSRYSGDDEGTDIARSRRQQRVIDAIKKKALSREILLSPKKLIALKDAVIGTIETDLTPNEGAVIASKFTKKDLKLKTLVLSEDLLEVAPKSPQYDNLYVFIPRELDDKSVSGRSWNNIHAWVECSLTQEDCAYLEKAGN